MTLASTGCPALVCHTQTIGGVPISRHDTAAGVCDDVILGNQGAIERALHQPAIWCSQITGGKV